MELKDPIKNRKVSTAPLPLAHSLKPEQLFDKDSVNYQLLLKFYKRQGKLSKPLYMELIKRAKAYSQKEPNIIKLDDPVTIVGDVHGQFYDFVTLVDEDVGGSFDQTKYLFLGDYVDRGFFGIEVVGLLMALKIKYSQTVFMLRGNHQCRQMAISFNFHAQCLEKYDQEVYQAIMDFFDTLPLACIVNSKFLCIHGGISTAVKSLQDIQKLNRFKQIPKNGGFCDLMWADPVDNDNGRLGQLITFNESRGCSYYFGYQLAQHFLTQNKLQSIIRAHEVQNDGFKAYFWGGKKEFPTVITIFSAPNYCDYYNNKGAILKFNNNHFDIQQIQQVAHPYVLPNFQNLFEWSIPFVAKNVLQLLNLLIRPQDPFNEEQEAVPLFMIGKQKILQTVLTNLQVMTKEYMENITKNNQCPNHRQEQLDLQSQETRKNAEAEREQTKHLDQQLADANIQIHRTPIPVTQYETKSYESKMKFKRGKTLDLQNEKRPIDHNQFRLIEPNITTEFQQKKNQQEQVLVSDG